MELIYGSQKCYCIFETMLLDQSASCLVNAPESTSPLIGCPVVYAN